MPKPTTEWMIQCANAGTMDHRDHKWIKTKREKADKTLRELNESAAESTSSWVRSEAPYVMLERTIGPWTEVAA